MMKMYVAVVVLSLTSFPSLAQQPGSAAYNTQVLPAHGVGDTRQPSPRDRWGAYAVAENRLTGFVSHERSEADAVEAALAVCAERGGERCAVRFTVVNSCSAVATSADKSAWAIEGSLRAAERAATDDCGANCKMLWSACSLYETER